MNEHPLFTIFTPTYNRAHTLERCYNSIIEQSNVSLEWIIVDDGSIDKTKEIVDEWVSDNKIKIKYFYQENAGKQAAWNMAIKKAKGEFFIGLDSDDAFVSEALDKIFLMLPKLRAEKSILGIRAIAISEKKKGADSDFYVAGDGVASWFDELSSRIFGERIDILKVSEILNFLYPVEPGIKFIPEIWFYAATANCGYKFIYTNEPVRLFFDEHSHMRLSKSNLRLHARGHLISRKKMLKTIPISVFIRNPLTFLKTFIRYLQCLVFCLWDRNKK